MLCQAQGVQAGPSGLAEEPIGVGGGKGELFRQLPVGVKIQAQEENLLSYRSVEIKRATATTSRETARKIPSLQVIFREASLSFFTDLFTAAYR